MSEPASTHRPSHVRRIVLSALLAGGLTSLVVAVGLVLLNRDTTPVLTEQELETAIDRWERAQPAGYRMELEVSGTQAGKVQIEVRDKEVANMTYNGVQPRSATAREAWTVPQMFETLYREMELAEELPPEQRAMLRASFDATYGFPDHYRRLQMGQQGSVAWDVLSFKALPERKRE